MLSPQDAIKALISKKWTQDAIADAIGCTQGTISNIARGSEPNYALGLRIVELATKHCNISAKSKVRVV